MAGNGEEGKIQMEELVAEVLRKRSQAFQSPSAEESRVPSPRVFPSEHYRNVLGSILECGDADSCCFRPKQKRLSIYSQQKLISRSGRTLYSSGEGRPCHEVIRPLTSLPSKRDKLDPSPSTLFRRMHGHKLPKNSVFVHLNRITSTQDKNRLYDKQDPKNRRKKDSDNDRFEHVEGHHPDAFRIKKNRRGRGSNDESESEQENYRGRSKEEKLRREQEKLRKEQEKLRRLDPEKFRREQEKLRKEQEKLRRLEEEKLRDSRQKKRRDGGPDSEKLPSLMTRSEQQRLNREAEEKRRLEELKSRSKKNRGLEGKGQKFPPISDRKGQKNRMDPEQLWADGSDGEESSKYKYEDCGEDEGETETNEYSSWELATQFIKKPIKSLLGNIPPPNILMSYVRKRFPGEEWNSGCRNGCRFYPDGSTFVSSYRNGSSLVFYPHGGLAMAISAPHPTHQVLVFRDPLEGFYFLDKSLLGGFNTLGIGVVYNNQGATKLRYDLDGGFQVDSSGQAHRWRWNGGGQRILQKMNSFMSLHILDLDSVHLKFHGNHRGVRLNVGRGHTISLIAPNPFPLSRRPRWDSNPSAPQSTVTLRESSRRPTILEDSDYSDAWQCCQVCEPCACSAYCSPPCSGDYYC